MKVVYVSSLAGGGPVSHLRYLVPHVAAAGVDARVLCGSDEVVELFRREGIDAALAPLRARHDVRGALALARQLGDSDLVHTQDQRAGLLARTVARATGRRVVHTYHGLPMPIAVRLGRPGVTEALGVSRFGAAWLLYGYLGVEALLARLGAVVVPSQAMALFLRERGVPADRMHLIPSCIDVRRTSCAPARDPVVVGTVAALHYWKGLDVLLDACARIDRRVVVEILGDGYARGELEEQAARLNVDARFRGEVTDVRPQIEDFDVFVLPSRAENLPISILEAMASAVPVVATRVGGVPELLDEGAAGLLVDPENPAALAGAIQSLIDDPAERQRLGEAGARRVKEYFDPHVISRKTIDLYERLI
jgi:glycosyltransferase involved in cell wall biosynthesis